jgi:hypothetical protein
VTKDELAGQGYLCHDCDSNFVAGIQRQRNSSKPEKRPRRPKRGKEKKKVDGTSTTGSDNHHGKDTQDGTDSSESSDASKADDHADAGKPAAASVGGPQASLHPPSYRGRRNVDLTALSSLAGTTLPRSTAALEHFVWSQSTMTMEDCISTLESLARKPSSDHSEFAAEYKVALEHLQNRCIALARFYANNEFNVLYEEATHALDDYEGKELIQTRAIVEANLRSYGFFITPRMWSKFEIILIMCVLLDSSLVYQSINQKTGPARTENDQNRYP